MNELVKYEVISTLNAVVVLCPAVLVLYIFYIVNALKPYAMISATAVLLVTLITFKYFKIPLPDLSESNKKVRTYYSVGLLALIVLFITIYMDISFYMKVALVAIIAFLCYKELKSLQPKVKPIIEDKEEETIDLEEEEVKEEPKEELKNGS